MTGRIVIRSSPPPPSSSSSSSMPLNARQSPAPPPANTPVRVRRKTSSNVGELAGGTAANCVVVSCCCPCVLFECLILAVYKVPANLCRRMMRRKRQKGVMRKKKRLLEEAKKCGGGGSSVGEAHGKEQQQQHQQGYVDEVSDVDWKEVEMIKVSVDGSAVELDQRMWDRFSNSGFWRSPSQRFHDDDDGRP